MEGSLKLPFTFTEEYMDWGLVSGGAAMLGVLYNFIRIWAQTAWAPPALLNC